MAPGVRQKRSGKTEFAYSVCAIVKDSKPDMYNSVPKRFVLLEEAKAHGWTWFFDGKAKCPQGHIAARYVTNPYRCVDCARIFDGKLPIYGAQSNDDLISEAVTAPSYKDPAISSNFVWDDEKWAEFGVGYVNTGSVEGALKLVNALPNDLIKLLRRSPRHQEEFDAFRRDVDLVFLWKAEGSAITGSDRAMLARANATFPDRFGTRSPIGLDTQPYVNPDKACAELAQLLSVASGSIAQRTALGTAPNADRQVENANTSSADDAGDDVEETVLLGPPLDNSDLV